MQFLFTLFLVALFFILTPGVLLSIPKSGSTKIKALVHALVFGVIYHFTHTYVKKFLN